MRFFLLLFLSFIIAQPVLAQESIIPAPAPSAEQEIEDLLGKERAKTAEPQTLSEYADLYNQRCLQTQHPIITNKELRLFCSCASLNIADAMTLQQMKDAQYKTSEGFFQRTRLLMFAYAPCIAPPLYRTIYNDCATNVRNKAFMKNVHGTCDCIADDVSQRMQFISSQYIRGTIKSRTEVLNPLEFFITLGEFNRQMKHKTKVCLSIHEGIY